MSKDAFEFKTKPSGPQAEPRAALPQQQPGDREAAAAAQGRAAAAGEIINILSRSEPYRSIPLHVADALVRPAVLTGQFRMLQMILGER